MNSGDASMDAHTPAVLELLALEAPAGRFEELLWTARQEELTTEQFGRLEHAVRLALDVRAAADQRRRREASLASLVATARDLAYQPDLDSLLNVITGHSRRLLDFDMAYVSLRLPQGGSYVHRSDGETTALSEGLTLGHGLGLGEQAQGRQAPFWTSDYLTDDRFPHSAEIDAVVGAEGLRAILAVPMTHGDVVVGALYGASRQRRHFTPDEVGLLRSFADMAAAAIEATRRAERLRAELADTREAAARTETALACTRLLARTQTEFADRVLGGAEPHDIVRAMGDALDGTLVLRDASGQVLASTGELPRLDEAVAVKALVDSHAAGAPIAVTDTVWATHVTTGVAGPCVLLFQAKSPLTDEGKQLLYSTGQAVALVLLLRHSVSAAAGPARDEYLDDLLASTPQSSRRLSARARRLGIDPSGHHVVVVLRPEGGRQGEAAVWASSYAYRHGGLKTVSGELLVLLLPGTDPSAAARAASNELSPLLGHAVSAGAAGPAQDLVSVGKLYQEARRCLDTLIALGGTGGTASASDLGFLGLLLSDERDAGAFITSAVGAVIDYDTQRGTDLVQTLEAYFTSGGSPTRAAQQLHVHTNTVSRRLDRITELLGPDWQQPAGALEIQLALRLHRARGAVYPGTGR